MKRIISVLITTILIITMFSGCGEEELSIYYQIYGEPENLDPLLAETESETVITGNIFEGLMRYNANGELVAAGAESYSVSGDQRVYTFKLRTDKKWSNDTAVTAHDYVFALQRAADPETGSPYTNLISVISGVREALSGTASPRSIGVAAGDDHTLTITLSAPCTDFLERLTETVFMPCNREFFEGTKGKYGLSEDTILSNGCFEITSWDREKATVSIARSENYVGDTYIGPSYISFEPYSEEDETSGISAKLSQKEIGLTKISTAEIEDYTAAGYGVYNSYSNLCALVFNPASAISESNILKALRSDIDASAVAEKLPDYFKAAGGVVPTDCDISLSAENAVNVYTYFPADAREVFLSAQENFENGFPQDISVLCVDDKRQTEILKSVLSVWQKDLGAYFNIETVKDEDALNARITLGSYDIALIPFDCASLKAETFLSGFVSGADSNITGFRNDEYDALVSRIISAEGDTKKKLVYEAERMLIAENDNLIPLYFSPVSYAYLSDIEPSSVRLVNGYIDLAAIKPVKK